ncbi:beta-n-acetyltransferase [Apiospora marii]|uniref:Beta-n-acetyltransferase n=1 Tax=Apiospora marii TaxID=335849 RepID=A0ABR1R891_9PEZI
MSHYDTPSGSADIVILRDQEEYIPLTTILDENDVIVLLTPLVVPLQRDADAGIDPFESLGRALALRHPHIRHVPYTARDGITEYHVAHIHRAKAIIFVISGKPITSQPSQADIAEVAWMVGNTRPQIVLACYDVQNLGLLKADFPAIIQLPSYSPRFLQQAAAVLFGEPPTRIPVETTTQHKWVVEALPDELVATDVTPFERLWNKCLPDQFQLDNYSLRSLLDRVGWSRHYVVKLPNSGEIIGFCATYTTFLNGGDADLVGSIAAILVEPTYRQRGIGRALHDEALFQLKRVRGVRRLQLGSTFPRLLYGIPQGSAAIRWFQRQGWRMDFKTDGLGREVCDWVLDIRDWPSGSFAAAMSGFSFRVCDMNELDSVKEFVRRESFRNDTMGLCDQYTASECFDVVVGLWESTVVAAALTYSPRSGSQAELDLPWARSIGPDVGGATCICIASKYMIPTT